MTFVVVTGMCQFPPRRIVCLTEETVETLYLLGEQDRIVGVSGYAVRPPQVRREKPRVSAFVSADIPKIMALEPDLVLAFSDLQADIAAELVRAGIAIHVFNQRDIAGILAMIRTVGALVGAGARADHQDYDKRLAEIAANARPACKPKVYFEEWDDPGIRIDRDCRRRGHFWGFAISKSREKPHRRAGCRVRGRARRDPGLMVREKGDSG
jgi:iron complex transport system substrate-binding protein